MAAAAAMVGGGMVSAYGQLYQGHAAKMAGDYNATIAEENARASRQQAAYDERQFRSTFKRQLGDMRASIGASGVTLDGSPEDVLQDSAAQGEMDALMIKHQGEVKYSAYMNEASLQRFQGAAGLQGAQIGAAGSLLTAGGHAAGYNARRT